MTKISIRKESIPYIVILAAVTLILYYYLPWLSILPGLLLLFVIYFFRDPVREIGLNDKTILSPADGTIMEIRKIDHEDYIDGSALKVIIFLSLFNVHVNRSPISGKVAFVKYRPGKYIPAFKSHASDLNEMNSIGIENNKIKLIVNQITGFIARRIICWSKVGDNLTQGEKFGLIKFGSCTEIIIPSNAEIKVKQGDTVKGGITVIGVVK